MQTDEILIKPMRIPDLVDAIKQRLAKGPLHKRKVETLATILERTTQESIENWYAGVEKEKVLMAVDLSRESRCQHLPQLFLDLAKPCTRSNHSAAKSSIGFGKPSRAGPKTARLYRRHDGRGKPHSAGHDFPDAAKQSGNDRLQRAASWSHDHRRTRWIRSLASPCRATSPE